MIVKLSVNIQLKVQELRVSFAKKVTICENCTFVRNRELKNLEKKANCFVASFNQTQIHERFYILV